MLCPSPVVGVGLIGEGLGRAGALVLYNHLGACVLSPAGEGFNPHLLQQQGPPLSPSIRCCAG